MSTTWHSIQVKAGAFEWTVTPATFASDDPYADGSLLDQLSIATDWGTDRPMAGMNNPWVAKFGIVTARLADLSGLNIGDPVSMQVWYAEPGTTVLLGGVETSRPQLGMFLGRISDMDAKPHESGRVLVTVTCTDLLVDLAQYTVGTVAYPAELIGNRLSRLFTEAGLPVPFFYIYGYAKATDPNPQKLLEAVTTVLSEATASDGTSGGIWGANLCTPYLALNMFIDSDPITGALIWTDHTAPDQPFSTGVAYKKWDAGAAGHPANLPGVLKDMPEGWTVSLLPLSDGPQGPDHVIPASMVDLGVEWHRGRQTRVDQVSVTTADDDPWIRTRYMPNPVPIEYQQRCEVLSGAPNNGLNADILAATLLPEQAENGWSTDQVTLLDVPAELLIGWTNAHFPSLWSNRKLLVIDGVDPKLNPTGQSFHMGTPVNATLSFSGGEWVIDLELLPDVPRPFGRSGAEWAVDNDGDGDVDAADGPPYLTPANLSGYAAGITPADLAPTVTPYALRIVRRPDPS